ncbi:MAG: LytTR family DNA-binding domain-containing protein [Bacteroidota bacterium]
MKVIIIEDEPLIAEGLQNDIERLQPDIQIVASLASVQEALSYFSQHELPDLFFSDIQLPDGRSFDIFQQLPEQVPVIFCTAFDEYALEAFRLNGIDYLLKPVNEEALRATLAKYDKLTSSRTLPSFNPQQLLTYFGIANRPSPGSILVHQGDKIIPVKKQHIALLHKKDGITYVHTFDRKKYHLDHNLDELERSLGTDFYRANRQFIVHREAIQNASRYFSRKLVIRLNFDFSEAIIVSKAKASHFLNWLEG